MKKYIGSTRAIKLALIAGVTALTGAVVASGIIVTDHHHDLGNYSHGQQEIIVDEHGGGLDYCGGHNETATRTYHYHRGPYC
jgi:hypothetical protein